ncbi:MAG: sulfurtransferase-like selenium metabolism protein YedF [Clostridia bacterium]|nr:sulfurtransferase-like selenium metabolism protein YedF [Clostridia bacterium]
MSVEIDARGLACPKPVILTKKEIDKGTKDIVTIVDNEIAKENVTKLISKMSFDFDVEVCEGDFFIHFTTGSEMGLEEQGALKPEIEDLVIYVASERMGVGNDELGDALMKGYFYTLTERTPYPKAILFVNGGVKMTVATSPVLDHLRALEEKGVEILSCGTCLDYYNMKDQLAVGGVTNMYTILDTMNGAKKLAKV